MIQILSTLLSWLLLAPYSMSAIAALAMLWFLLAHLMRIRSHARTTDDDTVERFLLLSPLAKQVYLSQPCWDRRCLCRRYGFPSHLQGIFAIRDMYGLHEEYRCQPAQEILC